MVVTGLSRSCREPHLGKVLSFERLTCTNCDPDDQVPASSEFVTKPGWHKRDRTREIRLNAKGGG